MRPLPTDQDFHGFENLLFSIACQGFFDEAARASPLLSRTMSELSFPIIFLWLDLTKMPLILHLITTNTI